MRSLIFSLYLPCVNDEILFKVVKEKSLLYGTKAGSTLGYEVRTDIYAGFRGVYDLKPI